MKRSFFREGESVNGVRQWAGDRGSVQAGPEHGPWIDTRARCSEYACILVEATFGGLLC
jgi:hypothetical protein